jgi:transcriptional regulator with XRE-family HTH domain
VDDEQAKRLGAYLRKHRERLGLSARAVADEMGVTHATVVRFEQGKFGTPSPEKLGRLAEVLGLNLADIYTMADYPLPTELPSAGLYLRARYRNLSQRELSKLTREVTTLLKRHGLDPSNGPADGEDETPSKRTRTRKPTKKGGSS